MEKEQDVQNVTPEGRPVEFRVSTPEAAYRMVSDLIRDTSGQESMVNQIAYYKNNGKPFNQDARARRGYGNLCNVNFREFEQLLETAADEAHLSLVDHDLVARVTIPPQLAPTTVPDQLARWAGIIEKKYTDFIQAWDGWGVDTLSVVEDMVDNGYGVLSWPDKMDWEPKHVPFLSVHLPADASVKVNEIDRAAIRTEMDVLDLIEIGEAEDGDTRFKGWSPSSVRKYLAWYFEESNTTKSSTVGELSGWQTLLEMAKAGDASGISERLAKLEVVNLFVREGDGSVTMIVLPQYDAKVHTEKARLVELARIPKAFESMGQALWILPYRKAPKALKAQRGMGARTLEMVLESNRMLCKISDGVRIANSLMLKNTRAGGDTSQLRLGAPVIMLPDGMEPVQAQYKPDISGVAEYRGNLQNLIRGKVGSLQMPERKSNQPPSAEEVRAYSRQAATVTKSTAMHRYKCFDEFHTEIFRRLRDPGFLFYPYKTEEDFNAAVEDHDANDPEGGNFVDSPNFIRLPGRIAALFLYKDVVAAGVPPQYYLHPALKIRASRALGMGNTEMAGSALSAMMGFAGTKPDAIKREVERAYVAHIAGDWTFADRFVPQSDMTTSPTAAQSTASLENSVLDSGDEVLVSVDQPHYDHVLIHLGDVFTIHDQWIANEQSVDVVEAAKVIRNRVPHAMQHIRYMGSDPLRKNEAEKLSVVLGQIRRGITDILREADKVAEMQDATQKEQQRRLQNADEVLLEHERETQKMQLEQQRKTAVAIADIQSLAQQREIKTTAAIEQQIRRLSADLERTQRSTEANIATTVAMAEARIQALLGESNARIQKTVQEG